MTKSNYVDYILDTLGSLGSMKFRKMFGGYGIYKNGIFFAIISDGVLYFKVDDSNRSIYENLGSRPFTYQGKNKKQTTMSYWEVPGDIIENRDKFMMLVEKSVIAAMRAAKEGKQKKYIKAKN